MSETRRLLDAAANRGEARGSSAVYEAATDEIELRSYGSPDGAAPTRTRSKLLVAALAAIMVAGGGLLLARVRESGPSDPAVTATTAPIAPQPTETSPQGPEPVTSPVPVITRCEDLPQPWTASVGVELDEQTRTLWLTWETFEQAWVSIDDVDCAGQPGLRQFVESELATRNAQQQLDEANLP